MSRNTSLVVNGSPWMNNDKGAHAGSKQVN